MKILISLMFLSAGMFLAAVAVPTSSSLTAMDDGRNALNPYDARYTEEGDLIRPNGWRKWVFVGTPLTPDDMNDGNAAFKEFHNVYVDPVSFSKFEETGRFPNGTQIAKELVLVGSRKAVSGNGYFMGDFAGLEVAVKDAVRFADEPGGWAYFSFGHKSEYELTAKAFPTQSCNACHAASAETDFVFTQYYPVLREAMPGAMRKEMMDKKQSKKEMDASARQVAMGAMGANSGNETSEKELAQKAFEWLKARKYKAFESDSKVHLSTSGAIHGDVKIFFNDKLAKSMANGNSEHPLGSTSVKELYKDDELYGWALSVKTKKDEGNGNGWYWYENLSVSDNSEPVAASQGSTLCIGCHAPGRDFVLTKELRR